MKEASSKKKAFSRRRAFDPDADVDYINERNRCGEKICMIFSRK
jgi:hypothetical protein